MSAIGLSVPPGFTITTEVCAAFHKSSSVLPASVWPEVLSGVKAIEAQMDRQFGDHARPLLVSVRSGAAISMPGMMDTILNLGINDETVEGLAKDFGEKFALVRLLCLILLHFYVFFKPGLCMYLYRIRIVASCRCSATW